MKYILALIVALCTQVMFAQPTMPSFLQGIWKVEGKEIYERWDKMNDQHLKGFSYKLIDNQIVITEYLDLTYINNEILYGATVIGQNQGKKVDFKLTKTGNIYTFNNPAHDFPKRIVYERISDREVLVNVSDGQQKQFSYTLKLLTGLKDTTVANPNYNAALAAKLGGDEYGMKNFIFVILKTGTNTTTDSELINKSFRGHMENINRLVAEGKLIVAGPFGKNDKNFRGLFILTGIASPDETKKVLQTDPAIAIGLLEAEVFNWYGSAALPEYLPFSDKIWKTKP
ncbi:DUF6265 family protein [Gynurincola endophyticus]|uniref:DUF6265 family protein n=1 Tax=Gynurincola endophyticus TaxID=2479004 RepID=UPI000F8F6704|nr:DUF6265 family protein [Gynurincola endophyticus]